MNSQNIRKKHRKTVKFYTKLYKAYVKLSAFFRFLPVNRKGKILIIPPDYSFGSFGDQYMIVSIIENIRKIKPDAKISVFMPGYYEEKGDLIKYGINVPIYDTKNDWKPNRLFRRIVSGIETLYIVGADILDGGCGIDSSLKYYNYMDIAHSKGKVNVVINAFSFNDKNYPEITEKIKQVSEYAMLNVRDEISYNRLEKLGCKNLNKTADIAFLFDETIYDYGEYCNNLYNTLKKDKENGKRIIGIHLTSSKQEDYKPYLTKIKNALKSLSNILVVILPHDKRVYEDKYSDEEFAKIIEDEFKSQDNPIECINAFNISNGAEVKHIAGMTDLIITTRMHLAISALSKCVAPISFVYQGKFEGLYKLFDFKENLMFDKNNFTEEELLKSINYVLEDKSIKPMLNKSVKEIKELVFEKLKGIFDDGK